MFTPGNFEEPKRLGYTIEYVQSKIREAKELGEDYSIQELYSEAATMSNDELMQAIIQYLQQIANNTSNNNTLPAIQSILSGIISNMGSLAQLATSAASSGGDLSDKAAQMKDNIEQELNAMRSKMEALASTP